MQIGCNTLYGGGALGATTDFTVDELRLSLDRNAALGYETVEYSHLCHLTPEEAMGIGAYTRELGMRPWSVHAEAPTGFVLGHTPEEAAGYLVNAVEVCHAVGAQVVVVHAPILLGLTLGDLPDIRLLLAQDLGALSPGVARAAELGVELALEWPCVLAHWVYILSLLSVSTTRMGRLRDRSRQRDLWPAPSAWRPRLRTHLHDNYGEVDDHLPPGRGTIDWADLFAALAEVGYARPLQLELTDRAPHRDYDQALEQRQGIENTRRFAGIA